MFDSDLRRRVGVFLAWLALVALGAGGLVRDASAPARLVDQTAAAIAGAPYDGGHPFVRAGGLTLSAPATMTGIRWAAIPPRCPPRRQHCPLSDCSGPTSAGSPLAGRAVLPRRPIRRAHRR